MSNVNNHIARVTEQNIENLLCTEEERRRKMPRIYRVVSTITRQCGTVGFLVANAVFFAGWIAVNELVVTFDPFPYTLLILGVSLEAIFLSILILISQNMDAAESERRHHLDLQMNLLSEREITALMRLVVEMARRGGVPEELTAEARSFAHDTDPSGVLAQIIRAEHRHRLVRPGEGKPAR